MMPASQITVEHPVEPARLAHIVLAPPGLVLTVEISNVPHRLGLTRGEARLWRTALREALNSLH
jgi:hypothetical protein